MPGEPVKAYEEYKAAMDLHSTPMTDSDRERIEQEEQRRRREERARAPEAKM